MTAFKDYTGNVYNHLTAIRLDGTRKGRTFWEFLCSCGKTTYQEIYSVKTGKIKSCGCERFKLVAKARTTHGDSKGRLYQIYRGMINRCYNESYSAYAAYGAVGIHVCERWRECYENFKEDMFPTYEETLTLDRINPADGYSPENCRWVSPALQARNTKKRKNNTSGVTGVVLDSGKYPSFVAIWRDLDGQGRKKCFGIRKYGYDEAFRLACEYRAKMIIELNQQGAGYTDSHGH